MKRLKIHNRTMIAWLLISTLFAFIIFDSESAAAKILFGTFIMILTVAFIGGKVYKDFIKSKYYKAELDDGEK